MSGQPSDDEFGVELERFAELAEVMPGGVAILEDAGTLARIVNALPPSMDVMLDEHVLAVPGWRDADDPVITEVARLSKVMLAAPVSDEQVAAQPDLEGRDEIVGSMPTLLLGRRILCHKDDDPSTATELAYREDRAEHALDNGDVDVFLTELSAVLNKWAHRLTNEAVEAAPGWLESLPRHEAAIHDDSWMDDESFAPTEDTLAARLRAEEHDLVQGLLHQAGALREVVAALGRLCPPGDTTAPADR